MTRARNEAPSARPKGLSLLLAGLAALLVLTLFRLAFLGHFEGLGGLRNPEVQRALYLGLKFDLRWVCLLLVPAWMLMKAGRAPGEEGWRRVAAPLALTLVLALYVALVGIAMVNDRTARPWLIAFLLAAWAYRWLFRAHGLEASRWARVIWLGYAALVTAFTFLAYFVDFGAYAYIHTRLNGTLLMFLQNTDISGRMVWESYPVVRLGLLLALLVGLALWGLRALFRSVAPPPAARRRRILLSAAGSLLLLVGMYGKWSRYPLRWGEAFEAKQSLHAHLALNPVLFFLETRAEMDGGFDLEAVKATHATLAAHLGTEPTFDAQGLPSLRRRIAPRPQVSGAPNLVFIQLESLAAFKTSPFGNRLDPTPFLGRLAAEGILFERFYVVMENTSRSMFATLFGTPDVSSVQNATRNPLLVDQHSVLGVLPDYRKHFFLGGSANWAQIRAVLKHNLKDLQLHEEGSFQSPVVDVWGISDADLLVEAQAFLDQEAQPYLAYVQTSGNHPPFTIPKHHTDFAVKNLDEATLKAAGFTGSAEFNAVRLMDYALERFFERARRSPGFENTIFVLWADHGIPRGNTDPRFGDLTLAIHHVPCVIYAPKLLKPRRVRTIASQVDLMPTLVSLLGRPFWTQTLGRDLFDPGAEAGSAAFTFTTFRRPPRIGLLQGDHYLTVDPDGRQALFLVDDPEAKDHAAEDRDAARRMGELARAYHAWSKFLLSHNPPITERP